MPFSNIVLGTDRKTRVGEIPTWVFGLFSAGGFGGGEKKPYLVRKSTTMDERLQTIPFRSCADEGWADAWRIYREAFPECEQWREEAYARAFDDPDFEADALRMEGAVAGLLFHWRYGPYRYVEHLAVDPALRGRNIGSQALTALRERCAGIVLEIDPPEDERSERRLRFYERLGFVRNDYPYVHPSYRRPFSPHPLVLMSYPGPLDREAARGFADFVRERILRRYSDHTDPQSPRL